MNKLRAYLHKQCDVNRDSERAQTQLAAHVIQTVNCWSLPDGNLVELLSTMLLTANPDKFLHLFTIEANVFPCIHKAPN